MFIYCSFISDFVICDEVMATEWVKQLIKNLKSILELLPANLDYLSLFTHLSFVSIVKIYGQIYSLNLWTNLSFKSGQIDYQIYSQIFSLSLWSNLIWDLFFKSIFQIYLEFLSFLGFLLSFDFILIQKLNFTDVSAFAINFQNQFITFSFLN